MDPKIKFDCFWNWEDSFLTALQTASINNVKSFIQYNPFPQELPFDDIGTSTNDNNKHYSERNVVIETSEQFLNSYCKLEEEKIKDNSILFKTYIQEFLQHQADLFNVLFDVNASLKSLDNLEEKYLFVSNKTNSLHDACLAALEEEAKLVNSAESISQKLYYFNDIDILSQKIISHTSVASESFMSLLPRLDECILYLQSNKQFKEAEIYLTRFKHLQRIALTLIKSFITTTLEQIVEEILPNDSSKLPENAFTLYYAKFRSHGPKIQALAKQIEDRIENSPEFATLLTDCHQSYFYHRSMLLGSSLKVTMNELLLNIKNDHSTLMRKACAFMEHICQDETELFDQFFSKKSIQLDNYLESLCIELYDILRPVIIHTNHLETLAEMCSILKMEILAKEENTVRELPSFDAVVNQILQDVQERLVYRTHIYLQTDILNYNPSPGDLTYPENLEMIESISKNLIFKTLRQSSQTSVTSTISLNTNSTHLDTDEELDNSSENKINSDNEALFDQHSNLPKENASMNFSLQNETENVLLYSASDFYAFWYPTVRRSLFCLAKLYRCLDNTIFQGLAEEVISSCIQSLIIASTIISERKTPTDGHLFQIKHLLILREQITPFQIDFAIKERTLNFNNIKDAAYSLLQNKSKLLSLSSNNSLLEFLLHGAPHVTEQLIDSKKKIDKQLKCVCEEFINHITSTLLHDLLQFLKKVNERNEIQASGRVKNINLSLEPFATVEILGQMICDVIRVLRNKLPSFQKSMSLYLANPDTEYVLCRPIKACIQTTFESLLQLIRINYTVEQQIILACPTSEEISLILSSNNIK